MRISVADLGDSDFFDYCIIGTGFAGITCALALAENGIRIALLEAGELDYSDASQRLYQGEVVGDYYFELESARLRYFCGSSNH